MTQAQILLCLDKFRGSATAVEACRWLAEGIRQAAPELRVREVPVADGGEGTVAAFLAAGYRAVPVRVSGPTGEPVTGLLAVRGDRAVVELAQASGPHLLPADRRAPLTASTRGTGELLNAALVLGARREPGVEVLLAELGLDAALAGASLVVVGEGCLDAQSLRGKAPIGVADRARRAGVPVAAVAGRLEVPLAELAAHGIVAAHSLTERAGSPATAMTETRRLLHETGAELARRRP